jgi:hypothetical protein
MAALVDVLAEFFRAFGYRPTLHTELEGTTGRRHGIALLLEKDTRRLAVATWLHRQSLGPNFLAEFVDAVKDTGCDGGLVISLGGVPEAIAVQAGRDRILVWDSRRTAQELGSAVLRETCPDAWHQADPWAPPRASRILDHVHETVIQQAGPSAPPPMPSMEAAAEPAPAAPAEPLLASPADAAPVQLELPLAFGVLDAALEPAQDPSPPPAETAPAPLPEPAPERTGPRLLRMQVPRTLAASLARPKTRSVDRQFLRLVPHYVFDYEASLLVEGTLEAQKQTGRMAVDAATKKVKPWTYPLDAGELANDGADVDEKPMRLAEADARRILSAELQTLVTRDVVLEEDDSEWSVVVKKKVELAEDELRLVLQGVYFVPIWRVSGKDGSVEIDATNGQVVFEEIAAPKSDALLI